VSTTRGFAPSSMQMNKH